MARQSGECLCGSPPRVWGKRSDGRSNSRSSRFTPTRVGKTPMTAVGVGRKTVHPHACGENTGKTRIFFRLRGSPPRVWGKLALCKYPIALWRFTPTRVGKTSELIPHHTARTVHPHACGENGEVHVPLGMGNGSPPRVWGKREAGRRAARLTRFTPTRVGKTHTATWAARRFPVHPHACGENSAFDDLRRRLFGSPPRVWGKRPPSRSIRFFRRFTPTRVGKTDTPTPPSSGLPVHPHACGENSKITPCAFRPCGSPPRVWGKRYLCRCPSRRRRFTPTRVGKTSATKFGCRRNSVHPHACGENIPTGLEIEISSGSPPRVWGKPPR